jgi:hypothetical protein
MTSETTSVTTSPGGTATVVQTAIKNITKLHVYAKPRGNYLSTRSDSQSHRTGRDEALLQLTSGQRDSMEEQLREGMAAHTADVLVGTKMDILPPASPPNVHALMTDDDLGHTLGPILNYRFGAGGCTLF